MLFRSDRHRGLRSWCQRSLARWCSCETVTVPTTDWNPVLRGELAKPYWADLQQFVAAERQRHTVFPPADEVFAALHLTPFERTRVVIFGQDPYHGPKQAHGLCFSVRPGVAVPPSLANIHTELLADLGCPKPDHGNLECWARQGVLLLNATLTVRAGQAASHQGKGWELFTDEVLRAVNAKQHRVVFLLWGASARKKATLVDRQGHGAGLGGRHRDPVVVDEQADVVALLEGRVER